MKRIIALSIAILAFASISHSGFVNSYTKTYYWECFISSSSIEAGDGVSSIEVNYCNGIPLSVHEDNSVFELEYAGEDSNGWKIYDTQYSGRKFWFNDNYVLDVCYLGGNPICASRYTPNKGVVSGSSGGSNGYNYGGGSGYGGGSSSSGRTCAGCRGTGRCTMCNGDGYYWLDNYYSKVRHTCSGCGGSGTCRVCYGKGIIR